MKKIYQVSAKVETARGTQVKKMTTDKPTKVDTWKTKIRSGAPSGSSIAFRVN